MAVLDRARPNSKTLVLGYNYHAVCQLKSDEKVVVNRNEKKLAELAKGLKYRKVCIEVRGKRKEYLASELVVEIPKLGKVKLVVSKKEKKNEKPNFFFYMSTDLCLTLEEVLEIYENRWSIELAHREANQKFGFRDYQIRDKRAIERFMQLSFLAWTIILVANATDKDFKTVIREMKLSEILDEARLLYFVEMLIAIREISNTSSSREELAERLADLFWN